MKILVAVEAVDFRRGIDGLAVVTHACRKDTLKRPAFDHPQHICSGDRFRCELFAAT